MWLKFNDSAPLINLDKAYFLDSALDKDGHMIIYARYDRAPRPFDWKKDEFICSFDEGASIKDECFYQALANAVNSGRVICNVDELVEEAEKIYDAIEIE